MANEHEAADQDDNYCESCGMLIGMVEPVRYTSDDVPLCEECYADFVGEAVPPEEG